MKKILLLGDSLTQLSFEGWGSMVANAYQRRADVLNRGCSGYNTSFYQRLGLPDESGEVVLVTLFFGANDASIEGLNPHHHVPLAEYQSNLHALVHKVRETYQNPRILLITPPPLDHDQRLQYQIKRWGDKATGVLERTTENTKLYAQACEMVGRDTQVPCLNLFDAMLQVPDYGKFFNDGLHFAPEGHTFVGNCVLDAIQAHFPELHVHADEITGQYNNSGSKCKALDSWGPYHDKIDHTKLDEAF